MCHITPFFPSWRFLCSMQIFTNSLKMLQAAKTVSFWIVVIEFPNDFKIFLISDNNHTSFFLLLLNCIVSLFLWINFSRKLRKFLSEPC